MSSQIVELLLAEGKWLPFALLLATVATASFWVVRRRRGRTDEDELAAGLNVFYGCMIGTMGFGHTLAVTIKAALGTLQGSFLLLVLLGAVLLIPAGWLVREAVRLDREGPTARTRIFGLNAWLLVSLLALGLHNLPLAVPALLNLAYQLNSRRWMGWAIATVTAALYLVLLIGALAFAATGQSFEQFSGME